MLLYLITYTYVLFMINTKFDPLNTTVLQLYFPAIIHWLEVEAITKAQCMPVILSVTQMSIFTKV